MAKKIRCVECKKSVGLQGFKCKCERVFCNKHRMPEEHSCSYDFKQDHKEKLIKENPIIVPDKLLKI